MFYPKKNKQKIDKKCTNANRQKILNKKRFFFKEKL